MDSVMGNPRPSKRRRVSPSYFDSHSQPAPHRHHNHSHFRSSHKRTRQQFEDDPNLFDPLQTPSKRFKSSSASISSDNPFAPHSQSHPPPPPSPPHHHSVSSSSASISSPFGDSKSRKFQDHSRSLRENKKQRQRRLVDHRRSKRQQILNQKHIEIVEGKMGNLNFWNFEFATNSASEPLSNDINNNDDDDGDDGTERTSYPPPPAGFTSSDESMTDHSNLNAMGTDTESSSDGHFENAAGRNQFESGRFQSDHDPEPNSEQKEHQTTDSMANSRVPADDPRDEMSRSDSVQEPVENVIVDEVNDHIESERMNRNQNDQNQSVYINQNEEKQNPPSTVPPPPQQMEPHQVPPPQEPTVTATERKQSQEAMVRERTARRLEELRNDKLKEQNEDEKRHQIRERVHPLIVRRAHSVRNNAVSLITLFYPKSRLKQSASPKDVLKAFKRALANFHPDRTVNKSLEEQVEAEEIFKLLSAEKEQFQQRQRGRDQGQRAHRSYHHQSRARTRHGWF